jgi:coenzyme F420-0:L-glutamate ligase/coenzyme F420-1:gamma-L-glutamate ligase
VEAPHEIRILALPGVPEVHPGDDLAQMILSCSQSAPYRISHGDIVVVTHKIVSKSEGRLVHLGEVEPSALARQYAERFNKDPRHVEVVLRESARIVRMERGLIIAETHHGFICANAGVDASNVAGEETVCLLPIDPDASAWTIRDGLAAVLGFDVPIVITDSFGRPWREGIVNIAIGVSGLAPLADYRGQVDDYGLPLQASVLAVADEIAAASELVMGKLARAPIALVRGYPYTSAEGSGRQLRMDPSRDLFR